MTASGRRRVTRHCKQNSTTAARKHAYGLVMGRRFGNSPLPELGKIAVGFWFVQGGGAPNLQDQKMTDPERDVCLESTRTGAHTEAFQVTSEDDSDRDADANSHESVVNSTPPAIATSTVTAVAASDDMCEVCLVTRKVSAGTMWAISNLLQLCGCRCVYTQWMPNLQNANGKRSARVHVTIRTYM